ncbi:MAG TPA: thiamine pyrophosphate-binding protein [Thermoanaerobaculia bacterium]
MTVAEYLIARLQQAGLQHLFAVPGDYAGNFLTALDATPGIERIANVNELGCGYAADGYARFKGIGAACVQYGVGGFSVLNATAGSYVERVPVVVISASPSTGDRYLERTQGILFHHSTGDLLADQKVFSHVTVASVVIEDPETAPARIDAAIVAMLTHRRPIYIEVLQNVWNLSCASPQGTLAPIPLTSDPQSLTAAVEAAWARIQAARLPVLWAGVEIQRFGLQSTLQQIVDASGLPFTTTSLGKTVLDESQPRFVGTYAGPASPAITRAVMKATDCPIVLGTIITDDYLDIMKSSFGQMIEVNDSEARVGYSYYHQVAMGDFLAALLAKFQSAGAPRAYELPRAEEEAPAAPQPGDSLTYNVFYRQLSGFLKDQGLLGKVTLVLGESTSLYVFGNLFGLPPGSFVGQAAWGSLGHETGCALGIALATGTRPYVVAGDGGFRMICQELSSLAEQKCNAVVFVMSNDVYAIEQAFVNIDAFQPDGQFAPFDVLPAWDYPALAKAFGARGYRVKTVGELSDVLNELQGVTDAPALVEVVIPEKDLAPQLARLAGAPPQTSKYHKTRPIPGSKQER